MPLAPWRCVAPTLKISVFAAKAPGLKGQQFKTTSNIAGSKVCESTFSHPLISVNVFPGLSDSLTSAIGLVGQTVGCHWRNAFPMYGGLGALQTNLNASKAGILCSAPHQSHGFSSHSGEKPPLVVSVFSGWKPLSSWSAESLLSEPGAVQKEISGRQSLYRNLSTFSPGQKGFIRGKSSEQPPLPSRYLKSNQGSGQAIGVPGLERKVATGRQVKEQVPILSPSEPTKSRERQGLKQAAGKLGGRRISGGRARFEQEAGRGLERKGLAADRASGERSGALVQMGVQPKGNCRAGKQGGRGEGSEAAVPGAPVKSSVCSVQILGTGLDTEDTAPCVLLFFQHRRFVFNAGEGMQRLCTEHKVRFTKIDAILLTRVSSETAGGLPGFLLTLAGLEGSAKILGPSNLQQLVEAMKTFVPRAAFVHAASFGGAEGSGAEGCGREVPVLDDEGVVKISAVILTPRGRAGEGEPGGLRPHAAGEGSPRKRRRVASPRAEGEEGQDDQSTSTQPADLAVVYVCQLPMVAGKFDPAKARALGLLPGKKYGLLQKGASVEADQHPGTMVHPCDVMSPPLPGLVILVVDCPSPEHLPSLLQAPGLSRCPPLLVVGPRQLRPFLAASSGLEPLAYRFLDCAQTTQGVEAAEENRASPPTASGGALLQAAGGHGKGASGLQPYWVQQGGSSPGTVDKEGQALLAEALAGLGLARLRSVPVVHCPQAYGVLLEGRAPPWKLVYSGDTRPCPQLVEASRGATVLIHEATFDDGMEEDAVRKRHSMTREAVQTGAEAGAYRTILTHFSQRYPKVPVLDASYTDRTCVAFDLMSANLADLPALPRVLPALALLFRSELAEAEAAAEEEDAGAPTVL